MSSLVFRKASSALHTIRSGSTANAQANEKVNDTYGHGILSFVVLGEDRLGGGLDAVDGEVAAHGLAFGGFGGKFRCISMPPDKHCK